jgi:hypothetical protein
MRWARAGCWLAAMAMAAVLCLVGPARSADEASDPAGALAVVEPYVGEWVIDGKWASGEPLKGREKFEWGLNKKFITCRTWVTSQEGTEYERYQSTYAVKDGKLVLYNFAYDGDSSVSDVKVEGKVIDVRRQMNSPQGEMVIRQEVEMTDKNKFRWRVWLDRDGESQQIMDGEWVRKSS